MRISGCRAPAGTRTTFTYWPLRKLLLSDLQQECRGESPRPLIKLKEHNAL